MAQYTLELSPEDAVLRVDGNPPVIVEGKLMLDPGEHELTLSADGYHEAQRRILAQPRDDLTLRIVLKSSSPSAVVEASSPITREPAAAQDPSEARSLTKRQWYGVGVGGLGVASLAAGIALGVVAKHGRDESGCEASICPTRAAVRENDRALRFAHASTAALAVGGAALAAGAFLLFWPKAQKRDAGATARLTPVFSAHFRGATWKATW